MPLLALWSSNPATISQFTIEQVVKTAGSGTLRDGSDCSRELRLYLLEASSEKLTKYIDDCLTAHFPNSGQVLQDLVNELGRRLDYEVTNGRYQGTVNAIGHDGIWTSPEVSRSSWKSRRRTHTVSHWIRLRVIGKGY